MTGKIDIRTHDLHDDLPQSEKDRVSRYNARYLDIKEAVEADFKNVTAQDDVSIWRYNQRLSATTLKVLIPLAMVTVTITLIVSAVLSNTWILAFAPVFLLSVNIAFIIYNHKRVKAVKAMPSKLHQEYIDIMNRRLELQPSYMPPVIISPGKNNDLTLNDVFELYCDYMEAVFMGKPNTGYSVPLIIQDDTGDNDAVVINTIRYQDPHSIFFECDDGRHGMIDLKSKEVFSPHFAFFYLKDNTK